MAVEELNSRMNETAVVAFRATCIKNYPTKFPRFSDHKFDEDRGKNFFIIFSQNIVFLMKNQNSIQLLGKMSNIISGIHSPHQLEFSRAHLMEFMPFMQHHPFKIRSHGSSLRIKKLYRQAICIFM